MHVTHTIHLKMALIVDHVGLGCIELGEYLLAKGLNEEVVSNIIANRIDGELFTSIFYIRGGRDRIHLRSILDEAKKVIILNYFNHCNLVSHSGW